MTCSREMPRYQSVKRVWALQIAKLDDSQIVVSEEGYAPIPLDQLPSDLFARYRPVPGDYLVQYDDGYWSVSPRAAFEVGYVRL